MDLLPLPLVAHRARGRGHRCQVLVSTLWVLGFLSVLFHHISSLSFSLNDPHASLHLAAAATATSLYFLHVSNVGEQLDEVDRVKEVITEIDSEAFNSTQLSRLAALRRRTTPPSSPCHHHRHPHFLHCLYLWPPLLLPCLASYSGEWSFLSQFLGKLAGDDVQLCN